MDITLIKLINDKFLSQTDHVRYFCSKQTFYNVLLILYIHHHCYSIKGKITQEAVKITKRALSSGI